MSKMFSLFPLAVMIVACTAAKKPDSAGQPAQVHWKLLTIDTHTDAPFNRSWIGRATIWT